MGKVEADLTADILARLAMLVAIKTASSVQLVEIIERTPCKVTRKLCAETLAHRIHRKAFENV